MLITLLLAPLLACTSAPDDTGDILTGGTDGGSTADLLPPPGEAVASSSSRDTDPDIDDATLLTHTASMRALAFDLLHETAGDENLFASPYSISIALAMTYAGAEGLTESQMAEAMHFDLPEAQLHPAFNALDLTLAGREAEVGEAKTGDAGDGFRLSVVNQLFGQTGYPFQAPFLDVLAVNYGAGLRLLDFAADPDGNRGLINDWVASVTEDRILDLLPDGSITDLTKLVLVNAIYFKASWDAPFEEDNTTDDPFTTLAGSSVTVPTMHGEQETLYGTGDGFAIVDVPYVGLALTMTLVVPDSGRFTEVRDGLDATAYDAAIGDMRGVAVELSVPKFSFKSQLDLVPPMMAMGMTDVFDPNLADLSGMSTQGQLYVSGIFHQAFVGVDEAGTEAAAATAVIAGTESEPERATLTIDRPFLFLIRDRPTGAVLFMGQVVDPS